MEKRHQLTEELLRWFRKNARKLPWRAPKRDPYEVLVSELMLQQTQVDRVIPLFRKFVAQFPNVASLAKATEDDVLAAWSGLGYYRRARFLRAAAQQIVKDHRGRVPARAEQLAQLPGIGPYTAAAVASLAFDQKVALVDANVARVAARCLMLEGDPKLTAPRRKISQWVESLLEAQKPGHVNEALMELGAMVCTPKAPACSDCPLMGGCDAARAGQAQDYPRGGTKKRAPEKHTWVASCLLSPNGLWLLKRIQDMEILHGLWLPPIVQVSSSKRLVQARARSLARAAVPIKELPSGRCAPMVSHSITYRRITIVPVVFALPQEERAGLKPNWCWEDPEGLELPTSSLLGKLHRVVASSS